MTCKRTNELPQARTLTAERLRLLGEGQALKERLRELGKGHREVMAPRYYEVWCLLGRQQEAVERGDVPDWTTIQQAASALIEYCGVHSQMVCELYNTTGAYIALAEMALQVTHEVEERTAARTVVVVTPLLTQ